MTVVGPGNTGATKKDRQRIAKATTLLTNDNPAWDLASNRRDAARILAELAAPPD